MFMLRMASGKSKRKKPNHFNKSEKHGAEYESKSTENDRSGDRNLRRKSPKTLQSLAPYNDLHNDKPCGEDHGVECLKPPMEQDHQQKRVLRSRNRKSTAAEIDSEIVGKDANVTDDPGEEGENSQRKSKLRSKPFRENCSNNTPEEGCFTKTHSPSVDGKCRLSSSHTDGRSHGTNNLPERFQEVTPSGQITAYKLPHPHVTEPELPKLSYVAEVSMPGGLRADSVIFGMADVDNDVPKLESPKQSGKLHVDEDKDETVLGMELPLYVRVLERDVSVAVAAQEESDQEEECYGGESEIEIKEQFRSKSRLASNPRRADKIVHPPQEDGQTRVFVYEKETYCYSSEIFGRLLEMPNQGLDFKKVMRALRQMNLSKYFKNPSNEFAGKKWKSYSISGFENFVSPQVEKDVRLLVRKWHGLLNPETESLAICSKHTLLAAMHTVMGLEVNYPKYLSDIIYDRVSKRKSYSVWNLCVAIIDVHKQQRTLKIHVPLPIVAATSKHDQDTMVDAGQRSMMQLQSLVGGIHGLVSKQVNSTAESSRPKQDDSKVLPKPKEAAILEPGLATSIQSPVLSGAHLSEVSLVPANEISPVSGMDASLSSQLGIEALRGDQLALQIKCSEKLDQLRSSAANAQQMMKSFLHRAEQNMEKIKEREKLLLKNTRVNMVQDRARKKLHIKIEILDESISKVQRLERELSECVQLQVSQQMERGLAKRLAVPQQAQREQL